MSLNSLLTMLIFLALVWGGLAALLLLALRKEKAKKRFKT
jgi:hypothetical protein